MAKPQFRRQFICEVSIRHLMVKDRELLAMRAGTPGCAAHPGGWFLRLERDNQLSEDGQFMLSFADRLMRDGYSLQFSQIVEKATAVNWQWLHVHADGPLVPGLAIHEVQP